MMQNAGTVGRVLRIVPGPGLLSLLVNLPGPASIFGPVGFVPLLAAFAGFCPLWTLCGISTGKSKNVQDGPSPAVVACREVRRSGWLRLCEAA